MGEALARTLHPGAVGAYLAAMVALSCMVTGLVPQAVGLVGAAALCACLAGGRGLRLVGAMLALAAAIALANPLFNTAGDTVLATIASRPYTAEALVLGAQAGLMAASLVLWASCVGHAIGSDRMLGLLSGAAPRVGMVMGLAVGMAPRFARDVGRVAAAREDAGLSLRAPACAQGGVSWLARRRAQASEGAAVLSTVASSGLEGAVATADSMEARGFGAGRRTCVDARPLAPADVLFLAVAGAALALAGALAAAGQLAAAVAAYACLCLLPTAVVAAGEVRWLFLQRRI